MLERIEEWKRIFDFEENAITKALTRMAWDLAAFSCVVEMVRQAPLVDGEKQLNGLVMDMLASGFWAGTMQGIRRLVEKRVLTGWSDCRYSRFARKAYARGLCQRHCAPGVQLPPHSCSERYLCCRAASKGKPLLLGTD